MATWADIQRGIFAGESGGDYGALFNYQNRPDGRFSGVDLTQMSVDDALQFADPSGPYAQYVKSQVGRVATPMGAYQVVGKTLRAAKEGLGLTGNERMTPELQDRIGQWIYKEQGTGAWEGYKGPRVSTKEGSMMDDNTMNAGTTAEQAAASAAMQEQSTSDKYKDIAGNLAVAFNSMRLNPDPALAATIKDIRTARTEKQAKNKTLDYLEKIGRKDLVNAIGAGLSPREAIAQMFSEAAELRGFNRQKELIDYKAAAEGEKDTADIREYNLAKTQGFQGTFADWQQVGKRRTEVGTIPAGYELVEGRTPTGETVLRMQPIAGGPADVSRSEAARLSAEAKSGSTVLQDIQQAKKIAQESPTLSTGLVGGILRSVGGTQAKTLDELTKTIKANIGFDRLQRMRDESPTGGALGQVAVQELEALQSSLGSLELSQDDEQLIRNLERLERQYRQSMLRILNTEGGAQYFGQQEVDMLTGKQPTATQPAQPMSDDDLLKKYGG